ncbi:MAG: hypothetical protein VKL60_17740 [Sphaerospermopsis sp.]|nr:hypothetical protein [Sphaerospermopsis sp.]
MSKLRISKQNLWLERLMAITATLNLSLVMFDWSYVPWRDFYFRNLPQLSRVYDPIKGIEPHRDTVNYLNNIASLEVQVSESGLGSPQVKTTLAEIRRLSMDMIDSNPFAGAGKSGTLEKIKNRMRERVGQDSSKRAFTIFWSPEYLSQGRWVEEINFFNQQIFPSIASNYYRRIGENGELINNFWLLDLPFVVVFGLELLWRSFYIKRQNSHLSWLEAILWRWYDLFLLFPLWRWLRIVPVVVRLDQSNIINLYLVRKQIHQGIVANFAEEITEIVVVRVINQIQFSIKHSDITRWFAPNRNEREYIDINNINEVEAISGILIRILIDSVMPRIQPEINAILSRSMEGALEQVPIYRNLLQLPGLSQVQNQLSREMADQVGKNLYLIMTKVSKDPLTAQLFKDLISKFTTTLSGEMGTKHILVEIQSLLNDLLEEVKIN